MDINYNRFSSDNNKEVIAKKIREFQRSTFQVFENGIKNILGGNKEAADTENSKDVQNPKLTAVIRQYFPELWNSYNFKIIQNNNCYSYACNDPFDHIGKPQPGEKSNDRFFSVNVEGVTKASVSDGMIKAKVDEQGNPIKRRGYYLVALAIAEGYDYHWYRQDENGEWTHKRGSTEAINIDSDGKKITNPEKCNRGFYTQFGGYFYVPNKGLRIGYKAKKNAHDTVHNDYQRHLKRLDKDTKEKLEVLMQKCGRFVNNQSQAVKALQTKVVANLKDR